MKKSEKIAAYKDFLETESGKTVLKDLAVFCDHDGDAHFPGDPYETAYRLGKQRVIRRIQSFLNTNNQELARIVKEEKPKTTKAQPYDILYN